MIPSVQNRSRLQPQGDQQATSSNPQIAIPLVNPVNSKTKRRLTSIEDANAATALHLGVLRRFPCHVLPADQHAYMEWFVQRTAQKLPGAFDAPFWRTLLPQASRSEPAVLHAVLTLGSIHKRAVLGVGPCSEMSPTDAAGLFTLQQYTLATTDLRCHIETKGKTSVRVALITCAVFVQLEYLRGSYKLALTHLRHGLTLLEECLLDARHDNTSTGQGCWGWNGHRRRGDTTETDESILHTFMFLLIQARLLGQLEDFCHTRLLHLMINSDFEPIGAQFQSLMHARTSLEHILLQIFSLMDETRPGGSGSEPESESGRCGEADPDPGHHGHTHQPLSDLELYRIASIQENLDRWLKAYETTTTTTTNPRHQFSGVDRFALGLLQLYHTMACAMLQDCLDCLCLPLPSSTVSDISPHDILHSFSSTRSPPSGAMLSTTTTATSTSSSPSSSSSFHNTNTSSQGHTPTPPQSSSPSSYTTLTSTTTSTSATSTTTTTANTNPRPRPPTRTGNDLYTSILRQSTHLYSVVTHPPSLSNLPLHVLHPLTINESAATSIADLGWLPPLFYTALHARDIPTRAEAIRLLPLKPHREGIWDSCTAATLTQKILDLERRSLVVSPSPPPPLGENSQNQNQNQNQQPLSLPPPPDANTATATATATDTDPKNTVTTQYKLRNLQIELPAEADDTEPPTTTTTTTTTPKTTTRTLNLHLHLEEAAAAGRRSKGGGLGGAPTI
ncbi:hypothetical protein LTR06_005455 [Exophiala xenobiotica]|nr:hypothetical protein LTR06_005455 [Exophiala xenobiotica]